MNDMDFCLRTMTSEDQADVEKLLNAAELTTAGVKGHEDDFLLAVNQADELLGVIGLERAGANGLLRSLVVSVDYRNCGLAQKLIETAVKQANEDGLQALYLLTQTAERYLRRAGFERINREEIPSPLLQQSALQTLCPASSVCMRMILK